MSSERYVIDGKTYELPDGKLEDYERLNYEFRKAITNTDCLPVPDGCLSNKSNEPLRKVWREYRAEFKKLLVEVKE